MERVMECVTGPGVTDALVDVPEPGDRLGAGRAGVAGVPQRAGGGGRGARAFAGGADQAADAAAGRLALGGARSHWIGKARGPGEACTYRDGGARRPARATVSGSFSPGAGAHFRGSRTRV